MIVLKDSSAARRRASLVQFMRIDVREGDEEQAREVWSRGREEDSRA